MADLGHRQTDKVLSKMETEIRNTYLQATAETQKKLDDYLSAFKTKDQIKRKQLKEGKITDQEYNYWRTGQICIGKRWQEMVDTLSEDYTNADRIAASIVNGYMPEVYALNHNYTAYTMEKQTGMDLSFTLYDRRTVENLLKNKPDLLPKSTVDIPLDKQWNKKHIVNAITQGILQGESIPNLSKRLQNVSDMDTRAAIRNARTATTGAENAGRLDSYKHAGSMGIDLMQEWMATLDGRTRYSHRQLDGERIKVGDKWHHYKFSNGCRYPGDPQGPPHEVWNCRCTLVAAIKGIDQSDAPRNSKLGSMTYEEWKSMKRKNEVQKAVEKVKETKPVSIIDNVVEKLKKGEQPTTQEFIGAGEEFRSKFKQKTSDLQTAFANAVAKSDMLEAEQDRLYEEYANYLNMYGYGGDKYKELAKAWGEARKEYYDFRKEVVAIKNKLTDAKSSFVSELRGETQGMPFYTKKQWSIHFSGTNTQNQGRIALEAAYAKYPTSWVQASINYGNIVTGKVNRGYCSWDGSEIKISGGSERSMMQTGLHELGHRFESIFPQLLKAESDFYDYRTNGESLQKLSKLTGNPSYSSYEVAKPDKFINAYMGKDYKGSFFELFSMGAESTLSDSYNLNKDPEYENFIMGLLTTIGR